MANDVYEVQVDQLTVPKTILRTTNPNTGAEFKQNAKGKTYLKGAKIPKEEIADYILAALENEDHPSHESVSKKLKKASGKAGPGSIGVPFPGYDGMSEDQVVAAMRNLPSASIQAIKRYEQEHGEDRDKIVNYNIAYGESPDARQEGDAIVSSEHVETNEGKRAAELETREVPEKGKVKPGEGITGTGDGKITKSRTAAKRRGRKARSSSKKSS